MLITVYIFIPFITGAVQTFRLIMDFFAEGITEEPSIKFTAQEEGFFANKLPFLDPDNRQKIALGQAISLLKFSGLPTATQKKILDNLKLIGKSSLDYTEMKKVLRGVALAQNKIDPSVININANIKTKLPVFHDDDSDEEQQESKPVNEPPLVRRNLSQTPISSSKQQDNVNSNRNSQPRHSQQPPSQSVSQPPWKPPSKTPSQTPSQSEDRDSASIKRFQELWGTLSTGQSQKISGTQVKKLFGSQENRKQLAKIWKICSQTIKGYLTKGELYIFVMLIKSNPEHVPDALTPQMKETITKLDMGYTKTQKQGLQASSAGIKDSNTFEDFTSSKAMENSVKKPEIRKRNNSATSANFENFSQFTVPDNPSKKPQVQISRPQVTQQVPRTQTKPINSMYQATQYQLKNNTQKIIPQLNALSQEHKQSSSMLEETNAFLSQMEQSNQSVANKIAELKSTQGDLNTRLNQTCLRMRDVIVKQSELIAELMGNYNGDIDTNRERVDVVSGYVHNVTEEVDQQVLKQSRRRQSSRRRSSEENSMADSQSRPQPNNNQQLERYMDIAPNRQSEPLRYSAEPEMSVNYQEERLSEQQSENVQNIAQHQIPNNQPVKSGWRGTDNAEPTARNPISNSGSKKDSEGQENNNNSPINAISTQSVAQAQSSNIAETSLTTNLQEQEIMRIRKKQIFTVQMINYLAPIKKEEYPIISQRITEMTQNQLDALYAQLYRKYEIKTEQEKSMEAVQPPTNDDFSSNNFKRYEMEANQKQQQSQQQDFFAMR